MVRMAIEPITEFYANDRSYGFRPKRSCQDAIEHLFKKLSKRTSKQWIIEGDIQGCFDNIKHEHIINTLEQWNTPKYIRTTIEKMLKAKIFENETMIDSETGTPQGGILSPMLANVALTTLDNFCIRYGKGKDKNPIIRYADDFVIACKSKEEAEKIKGEVAEMLKEIGLTLSFEKTTITHIEKGFNFLGFNIRKYKERRKRSKYHKVGKLIIKPQKEKVVNHLRKIKNILSHNKTVKQDSIIHLLNPILQGFAMYYRFTVSQTVFSKIMHNLWYKLFRWAKRRHPNKPRTWVMKKYFTTYGRKWRFRSEDGKDRIVDISQIPIVRFVKIRSGVRVHGGDKETIEYWNEREYYNTLSQIYSVKIEKLYKRQKGLCSYCEKSITKEEIENNEVHVHHMNPRTQGGTDELNNLRLLHQECHTEAHSIMSREQMSYWIKMKGNYIKKSNIQAFAETEMNGSKDGVTEVEKAIKIQMNKRALERERKASLKRVALMLKEGHI
jgi:RNA-directed DNA polymerase